MNVSRDYFICGAVYLIIGIMFGMYMGTTGDHTLTPVHAHINLLGFTLMVIFGLVFRIIPAMAASPLARAQFWLHQGGALVLLVMLTLYLLGMVGDAVMPLAGLAELAVLASAILFLVNILRNGGDAVRMAGGLAQPG